MRAVTFDTPGDESVLKVREIENPELGPKDLRIRAAAAGVNRADLLQRRGFYPPPPGASEIIGLECAGRVAETGEEIDGFQPGDRVMALLTGGGYAEVVVAPATCVMPVPPHLSDEQAAAVPEVFLTSYLNLFMIADLKKNETAIVHGGSGGIGTASIQLIRQAGARVFVTAGSNDRCRRCEELGADRAVNYRSEDFAAEILDRTDGHGVDVILDCIGGRYFGDHLDLLKIDGRLVVIGLQGGARGDMDLSLMLRKRLSIIGSTLRSRSAEEKSRIVRSFIRRFGPALEDGTITPILDRTLPLEQAGEAHRLLATGEIFGKVVLTI